MEINQKVNTWYSQLFAVYSEMGTLYFLCVYFQWNKKHVYKD